MAQAVSQSNARLTSGAALGGNAPLTDHDASSTEKRASVPKMTQRPTPSQESAFALSPLSITHQERATGLEPATSSLGSCEVTTQIRYIR